MKWFYNMKIGAKLLISFTVVAIIAGIVGVVGITNITKINENDDILYQNMTVPLSEVAEMARLFQRARVNSRDMILYNDIEDIQQAYKEVQGYLSDIDSYAASFEETIIQAEVEESFGVFKSDMSSFRQCVDQLYELCLENRDDEAFAYTKGEMQPISDALRMSIDKLVQLKVTGAQDQSDTNTATAKSAVMMMIGVIGAAMVTAICLGIFISNIISKPVRKLAKAADRIAEGDLDAYIDINTKEEIGALAKAFNKMVDNLNEVISSINAAADQVAAGAKQVSDSSIDLSQGATEQASTIEELTASLEEIAAQTRLNADNSNQANSLAEIARTNAEQGNMQMDDMLKAMDVINLSSSNISKIIKVIDDIAFQTNLLALNAAVEAARAGQYGKGFAVVAEEVRNLAARSSNAAKETTEMIAEAIKNVEKGTSIAKKTSEALNKIVDDVSKVAALIGNIALASNEQATGINQVNQGVMMVSDVVQKNSATAEESATASEELSSQAENLKQQVMKFKLRKAGNGSYAYASYAGMRNIDPQIMRMLDNMSEQMSLKAKVNDEGEGETEIPHTKIHLSDKEFGKY